MDCYHASIFKFTQIDVVFGRVTVYIVLYGVIEGEFWNIVRLLIGSVFVRFAWVVVQGCGGLYSLCGVPRCCSSC